MAVDVATVCYYVFLLSLSYNGLSLRTIQEGIVESYFFPLLILELTSMCYSHRWCG